MHIEKKNNLHQNLAVDITPSFFLLTGSFHLEVKVATKWNKLIDNLCATKDAANFFVRYCKAKRVMLGC